MASGGTSALTGYQAGIETGVRAGPVCGASCSGLDPKRPVVLMPTVPIELLVGLDDGARIGHRVQEHFGIEGALVDHIAVKTQQPSDYICHCFGAASLGVGGNSNVGCHSPLSGGRTRGGAPGGTSADPQI